MFRLLTVALLTLGAPTLFGGVSNGSFSKSGIVFDGSLGKSGPAPFANSNYMIPANLGRQVGGNLFQSFSQFDLTSTQSATFTGPGNVQNILSRVTSGSASSIDGAVDSSIQGANLFFLNPAGVMFGPNAQINVSGSFAVSTANYLKLADGGKFNTSLGGGDVLTSAPVTAFGFLNSAPKGVSIVGNNSFDSNGLLVASPLLDIAPGKSLSIVAGDITMNGGEISGEGSRVNLISVRSAGEAKLDATNINSAVDVTQFTTMGDINLTSAALIDTSGPLQIGTTGPAGGPVIIRAGNFSLDNSRILSKTASNLQGGAIDITASETIKMVAGLVTTETLFDGTGGNIFVSAPSISMDPEANLGSVLVAATDFGRGNAGNIRINADNLTMQSGCGVSTMSSGLSTGNGGNIVVDVGSLLLEAPSFMTTGTEGVGNAGNITVNAQNVQLISGSLTAQTRGDGNGGNILVNTHSLLIDGQTETQSGILTESNPLSGGKGTAGNIIVNVTDNLTLLSHGLISASTSGQGDSGNINVTANSVSISGFNAAGPSQISSETSGAGNAGSVAVLARDTLSITAGGLISSSTVGGGNGGSVNLTANSLLIDGTGSGIFAVAKFGTLSGVSSGNAGNITVDATNLTLTNGAEISSSTFDKGNGGTVTVMSDSLLIDGTVIVNGRLLSSGIFAAAEVGSGGLGGSIEIDGGSVSLTNGGTISTSSFTSAAAGSIRLGSRQSPLDTLTLDFGGISSINNGNGPGGTISITTKDSMHVTNGSEVTTAAKDGKGGDITVQTGDLTIGIAGLIDSDSFGAGHGGNVNVMADSIFIEGDFEVKTGISSSAISSGRAGTVVVQTGDLTITHGGKIASTALRSGDGGSVAVTADLLSISDGGEISSSTSGSGDGGSVAVTANSLLIDGEASGIVPSGILATANPFSRGNAGSILVHAGNLRIMAGGQISSSTFADGNGGNVTVIADNSLTIDGVNSGIFADTKQLVFEGFVSPVGKGDAGDVMVRAGHLTLTLGGEISSSTASLGNGGSVEVKADSLLINGTGASEFSTGVLAIAGVGSNGVGGDVTVSASSLSLQNGGAVSAASFTSAAAGSVHLSLGTLSMNSGSSISSANNGTGAAGSVSIATTGPVELSEASSISTSAHGGTAGDVTVHTSDLGITQGAEISSSTFGGGSGGDIKVTANSIFVKGTGSAISAEAGAGTGSGGEVNITADSLLLENAGSVSAKSLTAAMAGSVRLALGTLTMESNSSITSANTGSGAAGGVFISATGSVRLRHGSSISTRSMLSGAGNIELISDGVIKLSSESSITASAGTDGGSIHLNAPDLVYLADSSITATAGTNGGGTGGNITIDPHFIILRNSSINASATGTGGNINLISDFLFNSNSPLLVTGTVSSGTVNIAAPQLDLGAELITLPDSLVSAANQLQERCTALLQGDFSSFISIGRGGTEPVPEELQSEF